MDKKEIEYIEFALKCIRNLTIERLIPMASYVLNSNNLSLLESIMKEINCINKCMIEKSFSDIQMIEHGKETDIDTYIFHEYGIIINTSIINYMGNILNTQVDYFGLENLRDNYFQLELRYDNGIKLEMSINDLKRSLCNLKLSNDLIKNIIKRMKKEYNMYIKLDLSYIPKSHTLILEYGQSGISKDGSTNRGVFILKPHTLRTFYDVVHYVSLFISHIQELRKHGTFRKFILCKNSLGKYIFYLITASVNNIDALRQLYMYDITIDYLPIISYCNVEYMNHDGSFLKKFRTPSQREIRGNDFKSPSINIIYPF